MMFVNDKKGSGFTLIELLVAVALIAIIITLVGPSFFEAMERRRLEGAGEHIIDAVRFARSEAIKQNTNTGIYFANSGGGWCVGSDDDLSTACDCTAAAGSTDCTVNGVEKVFTNGMGGGSPFRGISLLLDNIDPDNIQFEPGRGWSTNTDENERVVLESSRNQMCILVNSIGRVRKMSDMVGYPNDGTCNK